ncbi:ImuA family protein [Arachidicoccus sp.]|uniref:ImuA family protein n=1 Tax=Arachidicoccus sp. TaxID=1872624 RepID=UPI003D22E03F
MQTIKKDILDSLRKNILCLQGLGIRPNSEYPVVPLGPLLNNMPGQVFPTGAIHEFLSPAPAMSAATSGFIMAIIHSLMQNGKPCLWVSTRRTVFPPALKIFGIDPERVIFIDATREKEALWAIEEALRCETLCAVIGEIKELDFTQSRRLQLAVENSKVTGFVHRLYPHNIRPTACVARWQVQPWGSRQPDDLPGVGFPRWKVELLKIRNGRPGTWQLEWSGNTFHTVETPVQEKVSVTLKTDVA